MNENKKCPKCGAAIDAEWKHELCPACLMKAGLESGATAAPPSQAGDETKASENTFAPLPNAPLSIEEVRKLFPQLEVIEQVGRGGMGVVYKARQPQLDRIVALKILPAELAKTPGFAERFSREARALAKLNHPNIVSVFDFGNAGGHFYFIMEFVDGANLRQMILSKQISPEAALSIVPKVCEALQFAHDEGILHRDIKPENILIDKKGRVKIADFGLAKLVDDQTTDHSLTGTHQVMGTPRYMAPEQFENTKSVDHRADIYSLGVVFYEMLTGEVPMGRFALPSEKVQVDVRIDEVVLKSLEREPAQRYQHVSEVKTGVENVTLHGGHGGMASPPSLPKRDGETPSLHTAPRLCKLSIISAVWALVGPACAALIYCVWYWAAHPESPGLPHESVRMMLPGLVAFSLLGISSIIGATITGAVAISRIRRSNGQLTGLPFAAFGMLFNPSLLVSAAAFFVTNFLPVIGHNFATDGIAAVAACYFAARFAWRKIVGREIPTTGNSGGANFQSLEKSKAAAGGEDAVVRARASWFGKLPESVRSLTPFVLYAVIGALVYFAMPIVSVAGKDGGHGIGFGAPSPWLVINFLMSRGVSDGRSYEFHPFTLSFCWFIAAAFVVALLQWCLTTDNLVRYGRRWRDVLPVARKWGSRRCAIVLLIVLALPGALLVGQMVLIPSRNIEVETFSISPASKAYKEFQIELSFTSEFDGGRKFNARLENRDVTLGIVANGNDEPATMDVELPTFKGSYQRTPESWATTLVLDAEELTKWMAEFGKADAKSDALKKEAAQYMAILKLISREPPVTNMEFLNRVLENQPPSTGWRTSTHLYTVFAGGRLLETYLSVAAIFVLGYVFIAMRIQARAFALDRAMRERGATELPDGPLPHMRLRELQRDARRSFLIRLAVTGCILAIAPGVQYFREISKPQFNVRSGCYTFASESSLYKDVNLYCDFEDFRRDDKAWFVQEKTLPAKVELIMREGSNRYFNIELPGLRATWPPDSVAHAVSTDTNTGARVEVWSHAGGEVITNSILDAEQLRAWMLNDKDADELMGLLKRYATSTPATQTEFISACKQLKHLHYIGQFITTTVPQMTASMLTRKFAVLEVLFGTFPIFLVVAFFVLKRVAIREAVQFGTFPNPEKNEQGAPANENK
jgi:tRNA A-37 threonylcarbamoyl transferase component Bud32